MIFESVLEYNPHTGAFTWLKTVNSRAVKGTTAGSTTDKGYIIITLNRKKYYAHRLAWYLAYDVWPDTIDHINGIRTDNRLENLRSVTHIQNCANQTKAKGWYIKHGRYFAELRLNGIRKPLGYFNTEEEAANAYKLAKEEYFKNIEEWVSG